MLEDRIIASHICVSKIEKSLSCFTEELKLVSAHLCALENTLKEVKSKKVLCYKFSFVSYSV